MSARHAYEVTAGVALGHMSAVIQQALMARLPVAADMSHRRRELILAAMERRLLAAIEGMLPAPKPQTPEQAAGYITPPADEYSGRPDLREAAAPATADLGNRQTAWPCPLPKPTGVFANDGMTDLFPEAKPASDDPIVLSQQQEQARRRYEHVGVDPATPGSRDQSAYELRSTEFVATELRVDDKPVQADNVKIARTCGLYIRTGKPQLALDEDDGGARVGLYARADGGGPRWSWTKDTKCLTCAAFAWPHAGLLLETKDGVFALCPSCLRTATRLTETLSSKPVLTATLPGMIKVDWKAEQEALDKELRAQQEATEQLQQDMLRAARERYDAP